ncbi:helix-turn-helix transcriptional regulator [Algimonas arctica]|uniref:helix-turn-helix transcriptional regulator n=1 Tax=Algimonas arctica TaxID=1479486 RepID=UPI0016726E37|nr:helix-turn-helix transcriptional regulator [Algimonas arctica]
MGKPLKSDHFFEALITNIPTPVCVMRDNKTVLFSNPAFQSLRQNNALFLSGASLTLVDKQAQRAYTDAIDAIVRGHASSQTLLVGATQAATAVWVTLTQGDTRNTVILTIISPELIDAGQEPLALRLRTQFGLTGMETQCALLLVRGLSASAIAKQRGVSLSTIRTQLRAIRAKMCVTSSLAVATQISKLAMPFGSAALSP